MRDPDVFGAVLGRAVDASTLRRAWLAGARAVSLPDETYPVLVPAPGEWVEGILVSGLGAGDLARIRFFESEEYEIREAVVETADGATLTASFFGAIETSDAAGAPWSFEAWRGEHKSEFLAMTRSFMALYGRVDTREAEAHWERLRGARREGGLGGAR